MPKLIKGKLWGYSTRYYRIMSNTTKKILILTITAGEGHNSVAKALAARLESMGHEVRVVDCLKGHSRFWYWALDSGYLTLAKYAPWLYNRNFRRSQKAGAKHRDKGISLRLVRAVQDQINAIIDEYRPDSIVITYPIATRLPIEHKKSVSAKDTGDKNMTRIDSTDSCRQSGSYPPIIGIITDYCVHPTWEKSSEQDYIIAPDESLDDELVRKGYRLDQIKHFGIPTREAFGGEIKDKQELRLQLGLEDKPTVMIMFGGNSSMGNPAKLIRALDSSDKDFQIVFVAGRTVKQKDRIDKLIAKGLSKPVVCLGFVANVHEYMAASDVLIGKAGAISLNESLNMRLPLIVAGKVVAQEADNVRFVTTQKAGIYAGKVKSAAAIAVEIITNHELRQNLISGIEKIRKPAALTDICDLIVG